MFKTDCIRRQKEYSIQMKNMLNEGWLKSMKVVNYLKEMKRYLKEKGYLLTNSLLFYYVYIVLLPTPECTYYLLLILYAISSPSFKAKVWILLINQCPNIDIYVDKMKIIINNNIGDRGLYDTNIQTLGIMKSSNVKAKITTWRREGGLSKLT